MAAAVPGVHRLAHARPPRGAVGVRRGPRAAPAGCRQPPGRGDDRSRLPRHGDPGGDPAQRARGPELVHRLHAVPARDLAGPARGAAQLPDRDRRPHRAADRQRQPAGRGHGGRRGDDPGTPRPARRDRGVRRRRGCAPADDRGDPHPRPGDGHRGGGGRPHRGSARRRPLRRPGAVPRRLRADPRPATGDRRRPRARRPRGRRGRPARPHPARVARGAGRRRRRGVLAAVRRPVVLRRSARRLHVRRRGARAAPARPPGRRLDRRGGPTGVPARAADARAAHPPRQGDLQHLHRPGAAGRRRLDVRRVPRPRGAAGDRGRPQRPCAGAGRGPPRTRCRGRPRPVLRHRADPGPGPCGRGRHRSA